MSYILEALKKSDRERKQGEIPDLQSNHAQRPGLGKKGRKGSFWVWLSGGVLLSISVLALYWGMQRNSVDLQEKISALEKSVVQLKKQPAAVVVNPPAAKKETLSQQVVSEKNDNSAAMSSAAVSPKAVLQPLAMETDENRKLGAGNVHQPVIEEKTVIKPEDLPRKSQQNVIVPPPKWVASEVAAEKAEAVPLVQELPESVQKMLPHLKLAGHVFAKDPTKRMIVINNRICHEGDLVENQLVLEQIVWEGVVLRYQEIRFRMNIL
jgi:general secretion pathway protein B